MTFGNTKPPHPKMTNSAEHLVKIEEAVVMKVDPKYLETHVYV